MNRSFRIGRRAAGFTVVEVLVAIALFSFLFLPLMNMFMGSIRQTAFGEDHLQATLLAEREIEEVKYLATLSKTSLADLAGSMNRTRKAGGRYTVTTKVETGKKITAKSARGNVEAKLAECRVTVTWDEGGAERKLELATLVDRTRY